MKKIYISIFVVVVGLISCFLVNSNNNKVVITNDLKESFNTSDTLALMYETDVNSGNYAISNDISFPSNEYLINMRLSKCENGSEITWDSINKKVALRGNISDKCYIYFDKVASNTFVFNYKAEGQKFEVPYTGNYKIELWGASGGDLAVYKGGRGAYTSGNIYLTKGATLHIYTGGLSNAINAVSFNGGGGTNAYNIYGMPGGGATDVRLEAGNWDNFSGLKSRIMVAAGGGGANNRNSEPSEYWFGAGNGGYGGALIGGNGESPDETHTNPDTGLAFGWVIGLGATQIRGGALSCHMVVGDCPTRTGSFFGYAITEQSGGGGGYYGGGSCGHGGAGGGSSFISGHSGCNAIKEESTENKIIHTGSANHYSDYIFTNTNMIAGNAEMPNPNGGTELGHTGTGVAKITLLEIR